MSKKAATQPTPSSSSRQATRDLPGPCSSGIRRQPKATIEESTDEEDYTANVQQHGGTPFNPQAIVEHIDDELYDISVTNRHDQGMCNGKFRLI